MRCLFYFFPLILFVVRLEPLNASLDLEILLRDFTNGTKAVDFGTMVADIHFLKRSPHDSKRDVLLVGLPRKIIKSFCLNLNVQLHGLKFEAETWYTTGVRSCVVSET